MSKVFMNAKGEFLRFWRAEKGGFVAGSYWSYSWEYDINKATVCDYIPTASREQWEAQHCPDYAVVAILEAKVVTTRVVTLIKPTPDSQ